MFPGQGVQHPSMLAWLDDEPAAAAGLADLAAAIGADWRARLADPAWSERNRIAQPLITATSLAAFDVLLQAGLPRPTTVMGYSIGEVAAFSAAGVFDRAQALQLSTQRSEAMDESAGGRDGRLISVSGVGESDIDEICARESLEVAIRIAPQRCLLGGDSSALDRAAVDLSARGADITRLPIRVASHTSWMLAASRQMALRIAAMSWSPPLAAVITNRDGTASRDVGDLKQCLADQIARTVQWQTCMDTLAERRPRCILEVGPGTSLSRMWTASNAQIPARSVEEFSSPQQAVAWVAARLPA